MTATYPGGVGGMRERCLGAPRFAAVKLAANLGFLWTDLPLPQAIRVAGQAGFGAVECHYPYAYPTEVIASALEEAGIPMLGLNTITGGEGEFGLAALVDRVDAARAAIDQAVAYGAAIDAGHVSVLAGVTGRTDAAEQTYRENLRYAADRAGEAGLNVVIEPLSQQAVPGAHLSLVADAVETVAAVDRPNLSIMLDTFHTHVGEGHVFDRIGKALPCIGHIQFAAVPDRAEPDHGEIDYGELLPAVVTLGYEGWFGAEYRPRTTTDEGLAWLASFDQQP